MKHLLTAALVAAVVLAGGAASATVFLYEDFEGGDDWWVGGEAGLWHTETYRSHSSSHSMAYNRGNPYYDYDTGTRNWGIVYSPVIDITGASAVYMEAWSWLETENSDGQESYTWDIAQVQVYDPVFPFSYEFTFPGDMNYAAHSEWVHLVSDDVKPAFDLYGLSQFRLGFYFDTGDALMNDYEGWYLDDLLIHDGETPPIPEPSTWLLLSTGLLGVGAAARKRFFG